MDGLALCYSILTAYLVCLLVYVVAYLAPDWLAPFLVIEAIAGVAASAWMLREALRG